MRKRVPLDESGDPALGEVALDDDGGGSLGRREQRPLERRETDAGDHAASEAEKTRPLVRGKKLEPASSCVRGNEKRHRHVLNHGTCGARGGGGKRREDGERTRQHADGEVE